MWAQGPKKSNGVPGGPRALAGRDTERAAVAEALRSARTGAGAALVVRGGPGTGRTALLDLAAEQAPDFLDVSVAGIPAESALPWAGLNRLLRPLSERIPALSRTQSDALRCALGERRGDASDRLVLGTAVLELLSANATDRPVICRVDDADQMDRASLDALAFAGRRLAGTRVAMLFAADDPSPDDTLADLPSLSLCPLDEAASRSVLCDLLTDSTPAPDHVVAAVVEQAHGNPLALVEFATSLTPTQLHGIDPPPEALPNGSRLRRRHTDLVRRLPDDCRQLLLLAAAAERMDVDTLLSAMNTAGLGGSALEAAESSGILRVEGDRVHLCDPLLRSSLYAAATLSERRSAHRLLAQVLDKDRHRVARAWHRAAAADTPSDELADELEQAGATASQAGDHAAASRSLQRSATLTVKPGAAAERLAAAARAAWLAGDSGRARVLLAQSRPLAATAELRCLVDLLRGEIELRCGSADEAYGALESVADGLSGPLHSQAVGALMRASELSMLAGDHSRFLGLARQVGALQTPDAPPETRLMFEQFAGLAAAFQGHHRQAAGPLRRVLELAPLTHDPVALILATIAAITLGDCLRSRTLAALAVAEAREQRSSAHLPVVLEFLAFCEFWTDLYSSASEHCLEGLRLATRAGQDNSVAAHLAILALLSTLQGDRDTTLLRARAAARQACGRGLTRPDALTTWAVARLALANGNPDDAADALRAVTGPGPGGMHRTVQVMATPDLVEVAARQGDRVWADAALSTFDRWAGDTRSSAMLALAARSHALLADTDGEADEWFREALQLHGQRDLVFERARTQLLYGRALRRRRRPGAARDHLRDALAVFELLDAVPWAEQARAELRAAGGTTRVTRPLAGTALTPQQAQIASLVASGATNREIAAHLYISTRTVDYHLRNIFAKLGVRSRVELVRMLS